MTNIKNYGQEAELACKNEPGYQIKMAELKEILKNSNCKGDMVTSTDGNGHIHDGIKEGYLYNGYGQIKAEIAENAYTCAPFVLQKNVISSVDYDDVVGKLAYDGLCPEGYDVKDLTHLKSGHTVVTCLGVIEDATTGQDVSGICGTFIGV